MQSIKEKTQNAAASGKAGMEKTKASVDEKMEKMKTRDPMEKVAAEERKEDRKMEADAEKQAEKQANVTEKGHNATTGAAVGRHHQAGGFGSGI